MLFQKVSVVKTRVNIDVTIENIDEKNEDKTKSSKGYLSYILGFPGKYNLSNYKLRL
jgi:hypothetical protein